MRNINTTNTVTMHDWLNDTPLMSKYAPDLVRDRFYVWLNDYHWVPMIVLGIL